MERVKQDLVDTTTKIQLDDDGNVVALKGRFKVSDLRDKIQVVEFYDEDVFLELNIRRMD